MTVLSRVWQSPPGYDSPLLGMTVPSQVWQSPLGDQSPLLVMTVPSRVWQYVLRRQNKTQHYTIIFFQIECVLILTFKDVVCTTESTKFFIRIWLKPYAHVTFSFKCQRIIENPAISSQHWWVGWRARQYLHEVKRAIFLVFQGDFVAFKRD